MRTGIGRNIFISAFSMLFLTIFISLKNNKKATVPSFPLGSNVAAGICTKRRRRQARAAENQGVPVHSQNKQHRKPRIADAARA
jgi:hypothetical protein